MKNIFVFIAITFLSNQAFANLDKIVEKAVKKHKIPSLSVMLLKGSEIAKQSFYGVRRIGGNDLITADDSFHLGSCGKAFTATLILKLVDEGKLTIEDSITKFLPQLKESKFKGIKVKHLMSHSSGLEANVQGEHWAKMFTFDVTPSKGRDIALSYINKAPTVATPGEKFIYSNIGYMVLGQIIESIEKETFENVIKAKLFKPLSMDSCSYGPVGRNSEDKGPWGHELVEGKLEPLDPNDIYSDNPPALAPAGGISCSQKDWAKFVSFIIGSKNSDYLSNSTKSLILKTNLDSYTFGAWGKINRDWSGTILTHAGSNTLNYAYVVAATDKQFAFLINTNSPNETAVIEMIPHLKNELLKDSNRSQK